MSIPCRYGHGAIGANAVRIPRGLGIGPWRIPDTNTYAYVGRGVNRRRNCRYRRNQVTTSISSVSKGGLVSCHWRGAATERLDNGAYRRRSVSATCGPLSFLIRNAYVQIQIQIQIGSLHTCLDETDAMTNTASVSVTAAYVRSIIPTKIHGTILRYAA